MEDERARLLAWRPGAADFTRTEMILAIGLQCREKRFSVSDVIAWLGTPCKSYGNSAAGLLVYFYSDDAEAAPTFDVADGRVVGFGTVARFVNNTRRTDPDTGLITDFNLLDEMGPFDRSAFI